MDLNELIELEISNGYGDANAQAKVCQDIILKAIATSSLSRNITIKGGVVMRSKTRNIRRATQDLDIDFIRLSLSNEAIDTFISKLNCLDGITLKRYGEIEDLKQQDYKGKRVFIQLQDDAGNMIVNKLDIGVHTHLNLEQEEYCFDIAFDEEGASVLINTNEQMFAEKLQSLLRLGAISTRYKDIFDMYYLSQHVETVVMLSHKKPDSVINVKVEFGEGEGKVPLDNIAKRAEAYKPKERVTYKMIKEYIEVKYGFKVHTAYIAEVKRDLGLPMYDAPNAVEELKQPRKHPTPEKVEAIKDALKYFAVI